MTYSDQASADTHRFRRRAKQTRNTTKKTKRGDGLLAGGAGANSRFAIGLVITAGMLAGTLFTPFVLPSFYQPFFKAATAEPASAATITVDATPAGAGRST
ncbi:MAG: hypothetical protein ABJ056_17380 [Halioglobus sp.]